MERYETKKIDETEFTEELNNIGELTGGEYNPGNKHLSVIIFGRQIKIPGQGQNLELAKTIYLKIMSNSKNYKPNCEFHFSKQLSTKHHTKGL